MYYPNNRYSLQTGFTLLEVLIALVILAVGTVAVIEVQSSFLSASRDSEQRSIAYSVAQAKLEDLRNYQEKSDFYELTSSSTGSWDPVTVSYGNSGILTFDFTGSDVAAFDSDGNSVGVTSTDASYKEISIQVNWNSNSESIVLSSIIGAVNPALSGDPGLAENGGGGGTPDVTHLAGEVPNVIPIQIASGSTRETSKPLPDVDSSGDSTEVRFETINYTNSTNTSSSAKRVKEDFLTVSCFCNYKNASSTAQTPFHYKYDADTSKLEVRAGETVNVSGYGTLATEMDGAKLDQSFYCTRCCEGHHDPELVDVPDGYPVFKQGVENAPHKHYVFDPATGLVTSTIASGADDFYSEACRFRRVDGIYELFTDWRLVDLVTFPYELGTSEAFISSDYSPYVVGRISAEVVSGSEPSIATDTTMELVTGGASEQGMARGIYLDDMAYDVEWNSLMTSVAASSAWKSDTDSWLSLVPFNEVNMTLLASWSAIETSIATLTDDAIRSISNTVSGADYYIVESKTGYSRGLVTPVASGATYAVAESKIDNTGILGNRYKADYNDEDNSIAPIATVSSALPLNVTSSTTANTVTVFGYIYPSKYEVTTNDRGTQRTYAYYTHLDGITVQVEGGDYCSYSVKTGVSTSVTDERGEFSCIVDKNQSQTIRFTAATGTDETEFFSIQTPKPSAETSNGDYFVELDVATESLSGFDFDLEINKNDLDSSSLGAQWILVQ